MAKKKTTGGIDFRKILRTVFLLAVIAFSLWVIVNRETLPQEPIDNPIDNPPIIDVIDDPTEDPNQNPADNQPINQLKISEDKIYDSKEEVALYLYTFHHLPSNYITKEQAEDLGWEGGGLDPFQKNACIGGDYFGNYEGLLPKNKKYHECDIDTMNQKKRGVKRIIYSNDWCIYYTGDHYESFELLYGEE